MLDAMTDYDSALYAWRFKSYTAAELKRVAMEGGDHELAFHRSPDLPHSAIDPLQRRDSLRQRRGKLGIPQITPAAP